MIRPNIRGFIALGVLSGVLCLSTPSAAQVSPPDSLGGIGDREDQAVMAYPSVGHPAPVRVMFQSLALPGWGQMANRSPWKAALFFGVYAAWVRQGVQLNQDKQDAVGRLGRASEEDVVGLEAEVDRLTDSRNSKFWFAGLTAVLAMADAYVDAHLSRFDERMDSDIALSRNGIQVGLRWSFASGGAR